YTATRLELSDEHQDTDRDKRNRDDALQPFHRNVLGHNAAEYHTQQRNHDQGRGRAEKHCNLRVSSGRHRDDRKLRLVADLSQKERHKSRSEYLPIHRTSLSLGSLGSLGGLGSREGFVLPSLPRLPRLS